jgi:hypothetical protein
MAEAAKVLSVDALRHFREALASFLDESKNALVSEHMANRRTVDWHSHQKLHWTEELKRRKEKHQMAMTELHRVKLQARPGSTIKDSDQKEAVRVTLARVREAEGKIEMVKRWAPPLQHAIDEYLGRARPLDDLLMGDVANMLGMLDRMIQALEAYAQISTSSSS